MLVNLARARDTVATTSLVKVTSRVAMLVNLARARDTVATTSRVKDIRVATTPVNQERAMVATTSLVEDTMVATTLSNQAKATVATLSLAKDTTVVTLATTAMMAIMPTGAEDGKPKKAGPDIIITGTTTGKKTIRFTPHLRQQNLRLTLPL